MKLPLKFRVAALCAPALLLAACGDDPAPSADNADGRSAEGDVLESSINDEMLPLDTIQSQSPPAAGQGDDGNTEAEGEEE